MSQKPATHGSENRLPLTALRSQFPLLRDVAYFQTGSLAPLADAVRDATVYAFEAEGTSGLAGPSAYQTLSQECEGHRARLAEFLGVSASEVGWTANTTTAIRFAVGSLEWRPGDTLITTNREHISTRSLLAGLRQRHGVESVEVEAGAGDDRLLSDLDRALRRSRTPKLLLLSQVSCQDGRRLPVAEASRIARSAGVTVLVDAAQSLGQFPVNLRELGCDMAVGSAHKWLLGPAGLGFLFVSRECLIEFSPAFVMAPLPLDTPERPAPKENVPSLAARIEIGTAGLAVRAGLAAALDLIEGAGLPEIETHVMQLTAMLGDGLGTMPVIERLSPTEIERSSGITSFTVPGSSYAQLESFVSCLWDSERVVAKVQVEQPAVRVSIAGFNDESDVARLLRGIQAGLKLLTT
jgi:selenocysteine lyase/cysteine desulfurase